MENAGDASIKNSKYIDQYMPQNTSLSALIYRPLRAPSLPLEIRVLRRDGDPLLRTYIFVGASTVLYQTCRALLLTASARGPSAARGDACGRVRGGLGTARPSHPAPAARAQSRRYAAGEASSSSARAVENVMLWRRRKIGFCRRQVRCRRRQEC